MRIAALQFLLTAVSLAVVLLPASQSKVHNSYDRNTRDAYNDRLLVEKSYLEDSAAHTPARIKGMTLTGRNKWLKPMEVQNLLRHEGGEEGREIPCCPSVERIIEPQGGTNRDNMYVQLYRDGEKIQRFYELACREGIEEKPCHFMDRHFHNISRCVQMYSYTYAIVREPAGADTHLRHQHHRGGAGTAGHFPAFSSNTAEGWMLDYIKVPSGCSCVLDPKKLDKNQRKKAKMMRGKGRGGMSNRKNSQHNTPQENILIQSPPDEDLQDNT